MSLYTSIALALACLLAGIFIGTTLASGSPPEPSFVEGAEIRDPDPTPLTCDRRTAREHMRMAAAILRRAYSMRRIVDEHPLRRRERRRWRHHRRCVLLPKLRASLTEARARARRRFDQLYLGLITPPGPGVLAARRSCESGGNYSIATGDGFENAYQFDSTSWAATAGRFEALTGIAADPSRLAAPREQDIRTSIWEGMAGGDPWPNCP